MHFFHTLHVSVYINNIKNFIRKKYISTNQKLWAWAYSEFVHFGLHFFLGAQGCSKSPGNHRFQCSRGGLALVAPLPEYALMVGLELNICGLKKNLWSINTFG